MLLFGDADAVRTAHASNSSSSWARQEDRRLDGAGCQIPALRFLPGVRTTTFFIAGVGIHCHALLSQNQVNAVKYQNGEIIVKFLSIYKTKEPAVSDKRGNGRNGQAN